MDLFWHLLELTPVGFLAGWAWVRWGLKRPATATTAPAAQRPTVYDPNPHMTLTDAPKGVGDPPPRAMKAVRHPIQQYPIWDVDERGWPMRYKLIPCGYVVDDRGMIIQHPNPGYNGTPESRP